MKLGAGHAGAGWSEQAVTSCFAKGGDHFADILRAVFRGHEDTPAFHPIHRPNLSSGVKKAVLPQVVQNFLGSVVRAPVHGVNSQLRRFRGFIRAGDPGEILDFT